VANTIEKSQPFIEHIEELRSRAFFCIISIVIGSLISYRFYPQILSFLLKPIDQPLYYSTPAGGFDVVFKICIFSGILFSVPVFSYHLFQFFRPIIPQTSKKTMFLIIGASCLLLLSGLLFAYYLSLPAAIHFLNEFSTDQIRSLISTKDYFSFISVYLVGFGIIFQLPLFLLLINSIHKLSIKTLFRYEKWLILISFILAAIITPTPDPINQTIMALPIILLYQVSMVIIWFWNKEKLLNVRRN
jgi:sec-independent protein translocase protein TatC